MSNTEKPVVDRLRSNVEKQEPTNDDNIWVLRSDVRYLLNLNEARHTEMLHLQASLSYPVPMIMHCPLCNGRHIDKGDFAHKSHHTHACQHCGHCWRPAVMATVGVQFLPGFKDKDEET